VTYRDVQVTRSTAVAMETATRLRELVFATKAGPASVATYPIALATRTATGMAPAWKHHCHPATTAFLFWKHCRCASVSRAATEWLASSSASMALLTRRLKIALAIPVTTVLPVTFCALAWVLAQVKEHVSVDLKVAGENIATNLDVQVYCGSTNK